MEYIAPPVITIPAAANRWLPYFADSGPETAELTIEPTATIDSTSPALSSVIPITRVRKNEVNKERFISAAPTINRVREAPLNVRIRISDKGSMGSFPFHCVRMNSSRNTSPAPNSPRITPELQPKSCTLISAYVMKNIAPVIPRVPP
ncbi:hypothetical protein D3C75_816350 [compost metagenome]